MSIDTTERPELSRGDLTDEPWEIPKMGRAARAIITEAQAEFATFAEDLDELCR